MISKYRLNREKYFKNLNIISVNKNSTRTINLTTRPRIKHFMFDVHEDKTEKHTVVVVPISRKSILLFKI